MLVELRQKAQITIPKDIVIKLNIKEGDTLEIVENDGVINIKPVVVYSKKYIDELKEEVSEVKARLKKGEQPVFDTIDILFEKLDKE